MSGADDLAQVVAAAIPDADRAKVVLATVSGALNSFDRARAKAAPETVSQLNKKLVAIEKYSQKLAALLEDVKAESWVRLAPTSNDQTPDQIAATLSLLATRAREARPKIVKAHADDPKDAIYSDLLTGLMLAWSRAHPKEHGVSKHGNDYRGPLLKFVRAVLDHENIDTHYGSRSGLGKRLYSLPRPWTLKSRYRTPTTK